MAAGEARARPLLLDRRAALVGALAFGACGRASGDAGDGALPPLRSVAPFGFGTCVTTHDLADPALVRLIRREVSQVTPGWEMKMGPIVGKDGRFNYAAADRIVAFARASRLRVHGHVLVWYKHTPEAFKRLAGDRRAFAALYGKFIATTMRRYHDVARGWDVVNEPINDDGSGLRDSLWSQVFGPDDYILRAFAHAAAADPAKPRFLNDYGLEAPAKRLRFLRLVERMLKRGARISGLGTQMHVSLDAAPGTAAAAIKDLASFGLPLHVSELDISIGRQRKDLRFLATRLDDQARRADEIVRAYLAVPARQRYAMTLWGLRDRDTWLRLPPFREQGLDYPLPFDDGGQPKPMARAMVQAFAGAARSRT